MQLSAPAPLTAAHRLDAFDCGERSLDEWLKRRALANKTSGACRTFVVVAEPVPVLVLGRLAVVRNAQGLHLGAALLQDAVKRAAAVAEDAGCVRCWSTRYTNGRRRSTSTTASGCPRFTRWC